MIAHRKLIKRQEILPRLRIPDSDGLIRTGADHSGSIRIEEHVTDLALMSSEIDELCSGLNVPNLEIRCDSTTDDEVSVWTERQAVHLEGARRNGNKFHSG